MRRLLVLLVSVLALAGCAGEQVAAPTAEEVVGTVPQAEPVAEGDPAKGKDLFAAQGCNGCHTFTPANAKGTVGPNLDELEQNAEAAGQGTVQEYVAASIKNPNGYVAPGFQQGVMPSYAQLSDEQVADLVAFLTSES